MQDLLNFLSGEIFQFSGTSVRAWQLLLLPVLLVLSWFLFRQLDSFVSRKLKAQDADADLIHLLRRLLLVVALCIVAATLLELLNVPLTAFAFVSGAIAIGIGFGAQNIINNFISGWILMWERPIRIGDFIEFSDARGTVESINTRSTQIRRVDGVHMLVPNSSLLENTVVNWTLVDRLARTYVRVGVAYGSPVEKVRDLLYQAIEEDDDILAEPAPVVLFEDFGDSSLVFDAVFWAESRGEKDLRIYRSQLRFRITKLFEDHGIVISFPQRDVHLTTLQPLEIQLLDRAPTHG